VGEAVETVKKRRGSCMNHQNNNTRMNEQTNR
jgi:hypothetical protein